jgi:TATA-binding protein-associated factor
MPFIMRRMKTDVLKEIPEKIINDHHCELSGSQIKHYEDLEERIRIQT